MKLKIQKWSNSAAVKLPTILLSRIGTKIGDTVEIDPQDFRVVKRKYKLDDLLDQCDKKAKPPTDMAKWDTGQMGYGPNGIRAKWDTGQVGAEII